MAVCGRLKGNECRAVSVSPAAFLREVDRIDAVERPLGLFSA